MYAMTDVPKEGRTEVKMHRVTLRKSKEKIVRPQHPAQEKQCLASLVRVKGIDAWTLWDSGSTTSGITPVFAHIAGIEVNELVDTHTLQLGTVGSRSTGKFGALVDLDIQGQRFSSYLDVANFDRYNMVIGTPFMHLYKVILDFKDMRVVINGQSVPALDPVGDSDNRLRRHRLTEREGRIH